MNKLVFQLFPISMSSPEVNSSYVELCEYKTLEQEQVTLYSQPKRGNTSLGTYLSDSI